MAKTPTGAAKRPKTKVVFDEDLASSGIKGYPVPPPADVLQVWLASSGTEFLVAIPGTTGNEVGHTVRLRCNEFGFQAFLDLLRERSFKHRPPTLGTAAAPTNSMLAAYAAALARNAKVTKLSLKTIKEEDFDQLEF